MSVGLLGRDGLSLRWGRMMTVMPDGHDAENYRDQSGRYHTSQPVNDPSTGNYKGATDYEHCVFNEFATHGNIPLTDMEFEAFNQFQLKQACKNRTDCGKFARLVGRRSTLAAREWCRSQRAEIRTPHRSPTLLGQKRFECLGDRLVVCIGAADAH
jgi:hypothetical protein